MKRYLVALAMGVGHITIANAGAGIGVTIGSGPDSYRSRGAELTLWSDDGRLNAGVSHRRSDLGGATANEASQTQASAGIQFESGIGLSGSYAFNNEPDVEIETVGGGVSLPLDSAQATLLFLDYRAATYTGKGRFHRQLNRDEYATGLNHTFNDAVTIGASYSSYSYTPDPVPLETLFLRRQQRNLAISSVLYDLLDRSWSLSGDWFITEGQTISLFYDRSYTLFGDRSSVTTLSDRVALGEQWSLDLAASRIVRSDGQGGSYFDLGVSYYFE